MGGIINCCIGSCSTCKLACSIRDVLDCVTKMGDGLSDDCLPDESVGRTVRVKVSNDSKFALGSNFKAMSSKAFFLLPVVGVFLPEVLRNLGLLSRKDHD